MAACSHENACYIADNSEAAEAFMENSLMSTGDFRIDAVTIADIMSDYGASGGEFAMDAAVFSGCSCVGGAHEESSSSNSPSCLASSPT